jgi:hypothetical protein
MKVCAICKVEKPTEDFSPSKAGKPHSYCKPCYKIWAHQNYFENKDKRLAQKKQWRLDNPELVKAIEKKSREKHKEKKNKSGTEWAKRNPEKVAQYAKNWKKKNREAIVGISHRRRAKIRCATIGKVTKHDIQALLRRPCIYCGDKSEQIDHVIPLARGGSHSIGNLSPACRRCNQTKGALLVIEWKAKKRDISLHVNVQQHA